MRKIFGIAAIFAVCLGMLSACENAGEEITETVSESSSTTVETVSEVTEITEARITETEITEEITEAAETVPIKRERTVFPEALDMSGYKGKLYEWQYDLDIVSEDAANFGNGIISAAETAAKEFLAELCSTAAEYEGFEGKRILLDYPLGEWDYKPSEEMLNGTAQPIFSGGVCDDFDGDGKKESFILFKWVHPMGVALYAAVFVDSGGTAAALPKSVGLDNAGLYPVRYNGFMHMIVNSGYNNLTHHAEFYAVEDGRAVHKHSEFAYGTPYSGVFMQMSMAQASGNWLIFWNEEMGEYCTVLGDILTDEQAERFFRSYEYYSGKDEYKDRLEPYGNAEELRADSRLVGNICYVKYGEHYYMMFGDSYGSFSIDPNTRFIDADQRYDRIFVSGVDVLNAEQTMVRLKYDDTKREGFEGNKVYTGKFYEWRYDEDIVADRENFGGGEDIIKAAAEEVKKAELGGFGCEESITYEQAKELVESAVWDKTRERYCIIVNGEAKYFDKDWYERYTVDGTLEPIFQHGVWEDFDGDGKKEGFMIFGLFNPANGFDSRIGFLVYADSEGNVSIPEDGCGVCGGWLRPIRYNGFIHMCVEFGMSIGTHHAEFYAVKDGKAVKIHSEFMPGSNYGGIFMEVSAAQEMGSRFIFWNEEAGKYSTVGSERMTYEEAEEIWNSEEYQGVNHDVTLTEVYKNPEELQKGGFVVGKKYFMVCPPYCFEYKNGKFVWAESHWGGGTVVDMDRAVNGDVVRLEE